MEFKLNRDRINSRLESMSVYREAGKVTKSLGLIYEAHLPGAAVGSVCTIKLQGGGTVEAEVVGFRDRRVILMPYEDSKGINNESVVLISQKISSVTVGHHLLGRVLDGRGRALDQLGPLPTATEDPHSGLREVELYQQPSHPLGREIIQEPLDLGVRAINGLLTCGKGQRMGIMAGSGVGKSVLLGMISRFTSADVNVIALIGERGREVREFIERDLGPEGMAKTIVVVATSDKSPLLRVRAAHLAASIAESFRDEGKDVLFLMDSATRFCMAQREIGLSMGEPPSSRGYTPSVFAALPKLLERAGTSEGKGSITGLYTVLVEGDDMDDPIADAMRSILDGHIVLSRKLAQRNHFPAIDVLQSASRVMRSVTAKDHDRWAGQLREWMALYAQIEDLLNIGAYAKGSHPKMDQAIAVHERIQAFLSQSMSERAKIDVTLAAMHGIVRAGEALQAAQNAQPQNTRAQSAPSGNSGLRF